MYVLRHPPRVEVKAAELATIPPPLPPPPAVMVVDVAVDPVEERKAKAISDLVKRGFGWAVSR